MGQNCVKVIFMEDHIPIRQDRSLQSGRHTSGLYRMWSSMKITLHTFTIQVHIANAYSIFYHPSL